ncbi:MAG: hypothetical protein M3Q78_03320 [Acidobacteriota bacterium]|nr:hypothetical protein [Acidobacteriota bacterium]
MDLELPDALKTESRRKVETIWTRKNDNSAKIKQRCRKFLCELFSNFCAKITAKGEILWDS